MIASVPFSIVRVAPILLIAFSCNSPFLSGEAASIDRRYRSRVVQRLPFLVIPAAKEISEQPSWFSQRQLQNNGTDESFRPCPLCNGFPVFENVFPPYEPSPPELPAGLTCLDFQDIAATVPEMYHEWSDCQFLQRVFALHCCDTPPPYQCEQNVRNRIFANYDSAVAPIQKGKQLEIGVKLDFFHISDLDLKSATAEIFVWLHLNWTDPRLAWDERANVTLEDELCASSVAARASLDAELTELWVPDLDLLNQANGVQQMPTAYATVDKDGTVTWIRNGGLRALCFFTGLRAFPYDTLGCTFLMGEWTRQANVKLILGGENGDGLYVGDTAQDIKYTEYRLIPHMTETGYHEGTEFMVYYNFYFERAERYYVTKIVIPTIVFTVLAFGVFLLDPRVGERLTYGLTVLLVIIAQDIVTAQRLPVANERLWINVFTNASFYWVLVAMLESIFVMWLYFLNTEHVTTGESESEQDAKTRSTEGDTEEGQGQETEDTNGTPDATFTTSSDTNEANKHVSFSDGATKRVTFTDTETSAPPRQSRPRPSRAMSSRRRLLKGAKTLRQRLMAGKPKDPQRYVFIKKFDRICFIVVPTTYIIFVIVMLSTKSLWNDEKLETADSNN